MKSLKHFYFYLFFSGYWVAYNLGEKETPYINAEYLMNFILVMPIISVRIIIYKTFNNNDTSHIITFICVLVPMIINYFVFRKKNRFKKEMINYSHLSRPENRSRRNSVVFLSFLLTFILFMTALCMS